jgi:hypothetical protein
MSEKLLRWIIFSVVLALIPIFFNAISLQTRGKTATIAELLQHGELYLIGAALCAAAIGELLGSGPRLRLWKIICGGAATVVLMFTALCFADVSAAWIENSTVELVVIRNTSIILFLCATISSGACITVAEV